MQISDLPFGTTDWALVPTTEHPSETGTAHWRTRQFGAIRVRMVDYSPGYLADHWLQHLGAERGGREDPGAAHSAALKQSRPAVTADRVAPPM